MPPPQPIADAFWSNQGGAVATFARNVSTRYLVVGVDTLIGLVLLPLNIAYFGQAAYGLWVLSTSLNTYFTLLDLGYGGSITRFVAKYRALRDAEGINEVCSTLSALFWLIGALVYGGFILAALNVDRLFTLTPEQVPIARALLLISGVQVALNLPFGVYGGVMNGFQRYDVNSFVSMAVSLTAAAVNGLVLALGGSLILLVAGTTAVRTLALLFYRRNAHRIFPPLCVRPTRFSRQRLREVTGFSVWTGLSNWATKLNFMSDAVIIGMFLGPAAVALWAVPRRIVQAVQSLTNQFHSVLMPVVVDADQRGHTDSLRAIFVHGTRVSLFCVVPAAATLALLADGVIRGYVGDRFAASVPVAQLLVLTTVLRVGSAPATTILKGGGGHRLLALTNAGVAAANITLSVIWIRQYALVGQAIGTLVPLTLGTFMVLWPAACRKVDMPIATAFRRAVWPALWPLALMVPATAAANAFLPAHVLSVIAAAAAGVAVYAATVLTFAVASHERARLGRELVALMRRHRGAAAAAA